MDAGSCEAASEGAALLPLPSAAPPKSLTAQFRSAAAVGATSRIFAMLSQFAVLLVLGQIMSKAEFGDFIVAYAAMRIIAIAIGAGLSGAMIYHISRNPSDATEIRLHRSCALAAVVVASMIGVTIVVFAQEIAAAFAKPHLASWLVSLTPFLVFSTLLVVAIGSFDGRGRITESILVTEIAPNAIRLLALPLLPLMDLSAGSVAQIMLVSVAVPWIYAARRLFSTAVTGLAKLNAWDCRYTTKLSLYSLASTQLQGIDIIVAGWLFSASDVADYAIASRVAVIFPFFQQMRARTFAPVAGWLVARNETASLQSEVDKAKTFSFASVTITVGAILAASPLLLHLFWLSPASLRLLAVLAFPPVFRSLFATGDRLLQVAGRAGWSLGVMSTAMAIVVTLPLLLHDFLGVLAIPIAMVVSGLTLNPVIAGAVFRTTGIALLQARDAGWALAAAAAIGGPLLLLPGLWSAPLAGLLLSAIGAAALNRRLCAARVVR